MEVVEARDWVRTSKLDHNGLIEGLRVFRTNKDLYYGTYLSTFKQASVLGVLADKIFDSGVLGENVTMFKEPKTSRILICNEHKFEPLLGVCDDCTKVDFVYGNLYFIQETLLVGTEMQDKYKDMICYFGKYKDLEEVAVNLIRKELYQRGFVMRKYGETLWKDTDTIATKYWITPRHCTI